MKCRKSWQYWSPLGPCPFQAARPCPELVNALSAPSWSWVYPVTGGLVLVPTRLEPGGQPLGLLGPQVGGELGLFLTPALPTDEATLALMKTPRCSLPDLPMAPARRKRQAPAPTKWNKRNLSWRWVGGVPPTFPRKSQGPLSSGGQKSETQVWVAGLDPPRLWGSIHRSHPPRALPILCVRFFLLGGHCPWISGFPNPGRSHLNPYCSHLYKPYFLISPNAQPWGRRSREHPAVWVGPSLCG